MNQKMEVLQRILFTNYFEDPNITFASTPPSKLMITSQ